MATGWLPSQIEQEDYGILLAVIERINEPRLKAKEAAEKAKREREMAQHAQHVAAFKKRRGIT